MDPGVFVRVTDREERDCCPVQTILSGEPFIHTIYGCPWVNSRFRIYFEGCFLVERGETMELGRIRISRIGWGSGKVSVARKSGPVPLDEFPVREVPKLWLVLLYSFRLTG